MKKFGDYIGTNYSLFSQTIAYFHILSLLQVLHFFIVYGRWMISVSFILRRVPDGGNGRMGH